MILFATSEALAQGGDQAANPMMTFIMFGAIFILFYFLLIRPQQKRQKQHREMVGSLAKGDEVVWWRDEGLVRVAAEGDRKAAVGPSTRKRAGER